MHTIKYVLHFLQTLSIEQILISIYIISITSEWIVSRLKKLPIYYIQESIANFMIGFISFITDFLFTIVTLPVLWFLYNHFRQFEIKQDSLVTFIILFVLIDFTEYWFHRLCHQINVLWSAHVVHHQSEFFNLSVGLRTSFFVPFFNIFFYLIFPIIGFSPDLILMIIFIQGIYQLLIHTELIGKLGILEYILVTPSAHRVHHGCNDIYIDKNYGKFLILWDRLFGSYQEETEEVVYGLNKIREKVGIVACIIEPYRKMIKTCHQIESRKIRRAVIFKKPHIAEEMYKNVFKKE